MAKILISGGSGMIGRELTKEFLKKGHTVTWLSRQTSAMAGVRLLSYDKIKQEGFDADVVIQLAGAGIVDKPWTASYKAELRHSRLTSASLLAEAMSKSPTKPKVFIGASAVGYYGSEPSELVIDEQWPAGSDFMARLCVDWEQAYANLQHMVSRLVVLRIGVVLSKEGGAYPKMSIPFKLGVGAALGSGQQYFPWIHVEDLVQLFVTAIAHENWQGTYNAVAPQPVRNVEFSRSLAKHLGKPFFMPALPEFVMKTILGERYLTVCRGLQISANKVLTQGYTFKYNGIGEALKSLAPKEAK